MPQFQLRDYISALRRYWWVVLLTTAIAAAAAYGFGLLQTPTYQAKVRLGFSASQPSGELENVIRANLQLYKNQLLSPDFLQRVLKDASLDRSTDALLGNLQAQAVPDDKIITVSVDDVNNKDAQFIANAIGDEFVEQINAAESGGGARIVASKLEKPGLPSQPYKPRKLVNTAAGAALGLVLGLLLAIGLALLDDTLKSSDDVERQLGLNTIGAIPKL